MERTYPSGVQKGNKGIKNRERQLKAHGRGSKCSGNGRRQKKGPHNHVLPLKPLATALTRGLTRTTGLIGLREKTLMTVIVIL